MIRSAQRRATTLVTTAMMGLALMLGLTGQAHALLLGQSVTGSLTFNSGTTNFFDPANGFVPSGYSNTASPTVTIADPAKEFGFSDGANLDSADFSDTQLTIGDVASSVSGTSAFDMTFTSSAFAGLVVTPISDTFPGSGLTVSSTGNTLTFHFAGASGAATYQAVFNINLPAPVISISNATVTEGDSGPVNATFNVSLSAVASQPVTVDFATFDGTATAGSDYQARSGTLTFAPGETSKTVTVLVNGDTLNEADETFLLVLTDAVNATIGTSQGTGTITNDDAASPAPTLSISNQTISEGNAGSVNATFTVTLSALVTSPVSVDYGTSNGTATAPGDYGTVNGTLTFAPGQTTKTITVPINGDTTGEADETFFVNLSNPTGASVATAQGMGTILNDDKFPLTLTIAPSMVRETDGANAARGTLVRSGPKTIAVTVNLASSDPAHATVPASITILAGQSSASFFIGVGDNGNTEGTIKVNISAAASGLSPAKATLSITDDEARLGISTSVASFFENAGPGAATVTITRNTPTTAALAVRLASSDSRVRVPSTVTFAAGQASVTFDLRATDNALADGPARVKLAVQAVGYSVASTIVTVLDNEAKLSLSLTPATFAENGGGNAATMTLTRNTPTLEALGVKLTSSNPNAARVPTSVTIPAGAASISFPIKAIDNAQPNAAQAVTFTATATEAGYTPGTVSATITDNDGG